MKNIYSVLILFLFIIPLLPAQTQISEVINDYTSVTSIFTDTCIVHLSVTDATPFQVGEKVVLIQMQGAQINESNSSDFGTISNLNGAGLYEINEIESVSGNNIFLAFQLVNNYDVNGNVQLVSMPVYDNAKVTDTLTATAWDGNKGGVLALQVEGQLFMEGMIDVSGLGFRGGIAQTAATNNCTWLIQQDDYFYDSGNWRGAAKGEGIAENIFDKEYGKGAQANGGGGGNDHNSGGGGGANVTNGGAGGKNEEPSTFGCNGNHPGVGGKAILDMDNRLFLGGGGGAGHENNEVATDGGSGGGIVILIANEFYPLGSSIKAHGLTPADGGGDGAGGGGGGGTILLNVQTIESTVHLETKGGDGGLVHNNNEERCHGPGGGGSGGRVITNLTIGDPFITVFNGGQAGMSINSSSCGDGTNDAQNGESGVLEPLSSVVIAEEEFPLPVADFSYIINGETVDFTNLSTGAASYHWDFGDGNTSELSDPSHTYMQSGTYDVQLVIWGYCGEDEFIIQQVTVFVPELIVIDFSFDEGNGCVPLWVQFSDESTGTIDSYNWTFEGGEPATSVEPNPLVLYNTPGVFDVSLVVSGPTGASVLGMQDAIIVDPEVVTSFTYSVDGSAISFFNTSLNAISYQWDFGDGSPVSTEENPVHDYAEPGVYEVILEATGNYCGATITDTIFLDFVDVKEVGKMAAVKIFPNPAKSTVWIESDFEAVSELRIYAMDGKELTALRADFSNSMALDIQGLAPGVYILSIENQGQMLRYKLVVY